MATDLAQFTQGVLERKAAALNAALDEKTAEQEQRLLAAQEKLAVSEAAALARIDSESARREATGRQTLDNTKRNQILAARQEALSGVFDKAYEAMVAWDQDRFTAFFRQVFASLPQDQTYTLILGSLSPQPQSLPETVRLSQETVAGQAGFVLDTGDIRYNYLFKALLADLAPEMMGQLSRQLDN